MTILNPIVVPAGTTILAAQSDALLPSQVQIGASNPNPTLLSLLSNGTLSASALFSTVTTGQYGGN
jgi:hypothetical protein